MDQEWQDISTAPRDGTVIDVTNDSMSNWSLNAKWGKHTFLGKTSDDWIVVRDFDFMPISPGRLICPTKWRPAWR
jgi:hypothetical protein